MFTDIEKLNVPESSVGLPPIGLELFLAEDRDNTMLSKDLIRSVSYENEVRERQSLYTHIRELCVRIPDISEDWEHACQQGLVQASELSVLYSELTNFLERDENNGRIILYLPFQMLPYLDNPQRQSDSVTQAGERFGRAYKEAWLRLLFENEPRASFVDGDVLEPGMPEPPSVRKAAHLLPEMVHHGLISMDEVHDLLDISTDDVLIQSLMEGLTVARDGELSSGALPERKMALEEEPVRWLSGIVGALITDLESIDQLYSADSHVLGISKERIVWEKQVRRDEAIDKSAHEIGQRLQVGDLAIEDIKEFALGTDKQDIYKIVFIRSVMIASELLVRQKNTDAARLLVQPCLRVFHSWWLDGSLEIKDTLVSALNHLRRSEVLSDTSLLVFGIQLPDLSLPFPVDLEKLVEGDFKSLKTATEKISKHPVLSRYIYPVVLVFGSRLKGYSRLSADIDKAIWIKPQTPWEKREEIITLLHQDVPEIFDGEKLLEYWTEQQNTILGFRQNTLGISNVVGPQQVHFFIGGAWIGHEDDIRKLQRDIIPKYLNLDRFGEQKEKVRQQLLRRIEIDIVQYRLMHKGYRRLYPSHKGEASAHAQFIDWDSDFWDPGYRRIATLLFISRVFLPDLSSTKR